MDGYRHYVRTDTNGIVILGFTTGYPEIATPQSGDLLLSEYEQRQFQINLTTPLPRNQYKYKVVKGQMIERTQAELDAEWAALPAPPDPDAELAAAIQAATTLTELKAALLGSGGKTARVKGKIK